MILLLLYTRQVHYFTHYFRSELLFKYYLINVFYFYTDKVLSISNNHF